MLTVQRRRAETRTQWSPRQNYGVNSLVFRIISFVSIRLELLNFETFLTCKLQLLITVSKLWCVAKINKALESSKNTLKNFKVKSLTETESGKQSTGYIRSNYLMPCTRERDWWKLMKIENEKWKRGKEIKLGWKFDDEQQWWARAAVLTQCRFTFFNLKTFRDSIDWNRVVTEVRLEDDRVTRL